MKVSVIVPYLNGSRYLEECIQSVEDQNIPGLEVLLVDDRAGEDVPEYILSKEYVRHIVLEKERSPADGEILPDGQEEVRPYGVAAARNAGVRHAVGEYLYFLDADDYLWEDALLKLIRLADKKNADAVTGNRYRSWFRRSSFRLEEAEAETELPGVVPLRGSVLESLFVNGLTVQHILVRRGYYECLALEFDENNKFYPDVAVVARMIAGAAGNVWADGSSIYVCRLHNDPVHLPSLSQMKEKRRCADYIGSYEAARCVLPGVHPDDRFTRYALNRQLVLFLFRIFPGQWDEKVACRFTESLKRIEREDWKRIKRELSFWRKQEFKSMRRGNYRAAKVFGMLAYVWEKKRGILGTPVQYWKIMDEILFQKMRLLPDTVLFESFFGKGYSDSPKYIFEYLNREYPGTYKCVWVYAEQKLDLPFPAKQVKRLGMRYFYYMARSKYAVFNGRQPTFFRKREGAVFLETWHGTPLKKLAFDMEDVTSASPLYKEDIYYQARAWDYLVAPNPFSEEVFRRAFAYDGQILGTGYPRNDILYDREKERLASDIRKKLHLPDGKKVILYAPTWRDDEFYGPGEYKFSLRLDLRRMREELGGEYVVLLRMHYFIADVPDLSGYGGFAYNVSHYGDVAELYLVSDLLVTDYSSVFFDYANLRRPMLFFMYDLEKYCSVLRGFYIDVEEELPGPVLSDTEEIIGAVQNISAVQKKYKDKYDKFCGKYCAWEDGHAAERVVNAVFRSG